MLKLNRKENERVVIEIPTGERLYVSWKRQNGDRICRLLFDGPRDVFQIAREELLGSQSGPPVGLAPSAKAPREADRFTNCLSTWLPRLSAHGVPVPKTMIVRWTGDDPLMRLLDGKTPSGFNGFVDALFAAVQVIGGPPAFLRTGQLSGKHNASETCLLDDGLDRRILAAHVAMIVEESAIAGIMGLPDDVWAVRERLPVDAAFTAFKGLPICNERRVFIDAGKTVCEHFYWPENAIRNATTEDWREKLRLLREEEGAPPDLVEAVALAFADAGPWSVDFMRTARGWYCIDMARAANSWHPPCAEAEKRGWAVQGEPPLP